MPCISNADTKYILFAFRVVLCPQLAAHMDRTNCDKSLPENCTPLVLSEIYPASLPSDESHIDSLEACATVPSREPRGLKGRILALERMLSIQVFSFPMPCSLVCRRKRSVIRGLKSTRLMQREPRSRRTTTTIWIPSRRTCPQTWIGSQPI